MQHNTTQPPSAGKNAHIINLWSTLIVQNYPWVVGGKDARKRYGLYYTIKDLCQRSQSKLLKLCKNNGPTNNRSIGIEICGRNYLYTQRKYEM